MLQYAGMEQKSRNITQSRSDVFLKSRISDRRFSHIGSEAHVPRTIPDMRIKYRADKSPVRPVIQRTIANAQNFRAVAYQIAAAPNADYTSRTVGVSNNMFAITPMLRGNLQQAEAQNRSGNRQYAGAVPGGNQSGNHAEKKLIHYDGALSEIGVTRAICQSCVNAICANAANIAHVSDPNGTYAVAANGLNRVAN